MNKVAVVILNYNGRNFLIDFLPTVIQHSQPYQVIVADNASTDDSLQVLKEHFPSVPLIVLDKNYGFCGGYNRALAQVESEYYILLNSDVEVTEGWIDPLLEQIEADQNVAAVQPKLLSFHKRSEFEYAGGAGGYIDRYGYPFCRGRIFNALEEDCGQYDDVRNIFWATGAALMIRAKLYHQFGGLDEDFFAHMEEIDLCWRMQHQGHLVQFCPQSVIYHVGGGTLNKSNPRKTYLNYRNGLFLLLKNLPLIELITRVPVRFVLDWISVFKFLIVGNVGDPIAIIKAHLHVMMNLKRTLNKRSSKLRNSKTMHGYYVRFLLFDYYLRRIRNFSKLPIRQ